MPPKRTASSSSAGASGRPAKKPDLKPTQSSLSFAARKPQVSPQKRKSSTASAAGGKHKAKVDVVELEGTSSEVDEEDEALETMAELERGPAKGTVQRSQRKFKEGEPLNPKDSRWLPAYKVARKALNGQKPIHAEDEGRTLTILRVFDNDIRYGPSTSISRLARWERAHKFGLDPPVHIKEILLTKEGKDDADVRETVFFGRI